MFDQLSHKLSDVFRNMRGQGKMTEKNVGDAVKQVKMALLEADVDYKVVKDFVAEIHQRALGQNVMRSVLPDQQFVKIVHEELISLMGTANEGLVRASSAPTILMMCGIQGSGKTTVCGKLARYLKKQNKRTLLVACDVYRPAAIKQLHILGEQAGCDVFSDEACSDPVKIAQKAIHHVRNQNYDQIIIDTAGRLELDDKLMDELVQMKQQVKPHEILFVADAMMGQTALKVAQEFDQKIGVDGVILSKLDGDARGGVALSVKHQLNKPIKFVGVGERLDDLEVFYPDRMASRILDMGDVVSLVEKAQQNMNEAEAVKLSKKIKKKGLDLNDFLSQLQQLKKMGSLKDLLAMMPGAKQLKDLPIDDKQLLHVEAIILSMTPEERRNPNVLNGSRRKRIAMGSGRTLQDVNRMLKQFDMMNKMLKKIGRGGGLPGLGMMKGFKGLKLPF